MREKTKPAVDVAAVTAAWDAFFQDRSGISQEQLEQEGWKDKETLYALGLSDWKLKYSVKTGALEKKKFKILKSGMKRDVAFYRPKV